MPIKPENDEVEVYKDASGEYRWRRVDGDNGRILYGSSESYVKGSYAEEAAEAYNPGIPVVRADR